MSTTVAASPSRDDTSEKIWTNSGDSHFTEPADVWDRFMPPDLAELMPRSVRSEDGRKETVYVDGQVIERRVPKPIPAGNYRVGDEIAVVEEGKGSLGTLNDTPAGAHDVRVRLIDLDREGVWAECAYPSVGIWATYIRTPKLAKAGARAINDWVVEEIMPVSKRVVPAFSVSTIDVGDAVEELQRCAGLGFRVMYLPAEPAGGSAPVDAVDRSGQSQADHWNNPNWNRLWAAAEEAGIVLGVHIGTDRRPLRVKDPGGALFNYVETGYCGQRFVTMMVASGVLERHPTLKVLVSEGGVTWAPFLGDRMNEAYRQHWFYVSPKLPMLPKEYINRQVYASFQHDESAIPTVTALGFRNVLFGSDYPHQEGTFGHTQDTLHHLFDGVDEDTKYRVTVGAFLELFPESGLPPALQNY